MAHACSGRGGAGHGDCIPPPMIVHAGQKGGAGVGVIEVHAVGRAWRPHPPHDGAQEAAGRCRGGSSRSMQWAWHGNRMPCGSHPPRRASVFPPALHPPVHGSDPLISCQSCSPRPTRSYRSLIILGESQVSTLLSVSIRLACTGTRRYFPAHTSTPATGAPDARQIMQNPHLSPHELNSINIISLIVTASNLPHMEHETTLRDALSEDGDIELRFQGGHSIPVHSMKLKLASPVLKDLISAVLDDEIASAAAKRRRIAEGGGAVTAGQQDMPTLKVGGEGPCVELCMADRFCMAA